jgi:hypothetical protein
MTTPLVFSQFLKPFEARSAESAKESVDGQLADSFIESDRRG